MIYVLTGSIVLLLGIITCIVIDSRNSRNKHRQKTELLRGILSHLLNDQSVQSEKIRLADELRRKITSANTTLSAEINDLLTEIIETLSKNDLIK